MGPKKVKKTKKQLEEEKSIPQSPSFNIQLPYRENGRGKENLRGTRKKKTGS
jgi:hypothetical protein